MVNQIFKFLSNSRIFTSFRIMYIVDFNVNCFSTKNKHAKTLTKF